MDPHDSSSFLAHFMGAITKETARRLPISRVRAICRTVPSVTLLSSEAPVLIGKLVELFIADVTYRAGALAQSQDRISITLDDLHYAISRIPEYDFLNILLAIKDDSNETGAQSV
ncbi:CCAAT-binding transcription factor subunit C [Giardia muris]|uniref:CCAAT-binding transcription factor subunit C n=1 Tax=Giardia muris TaxID=5742 RepID=A0A4Z1ST55_GIAMU|nr:CCAAT-binding transcription factor subunit C [Giardia muris]|eukprot:TNJ29122.1 CCAAT-binding transcription factor subunit C [Giardia muris]